MAIPAKDNQNPARILPGRENVYIIPHTDCVPGSEGGSHVYFSSQHIKACLVLKTPVKRMPKPEKWTRRHLRCSTEYDRKGMVTLQVQPISDDVTSVDVVEKVVLSMPT